MSDESLLAWMDDAKKNELSGIFTIISQATRALQDEDDIDPRPHSSPPRTPEEHRERMVKQLAKMVYWARVQAESHLRAARRSLRELNELMDRRPMTGGLPLEAGDDDGPEGRQAALERLSDTYERELREEDRRR